MKGLYLFLHLFTVSFPLLRSFEPKIQYARKWKALFPAILIVATFFIIWDVIFTRHGVWGFNEKYLTEVFILSLPVEEWLFFITVPFASVFIYECVIYFLPGIGTSRALQIFTFCLGIALVAIGVSNEGQAYTFWNFLFCGLMLMWTAYENPNWLGWFFTSYLFHLIPFLIVNGILTGSFIEDQVVWYNDAENLGLRIFTIPVEDTIYAMLLLLMNVYFFEKFKKFL